MKDSIDKRSLVAAGFTFLLLGGCSESGASGSMLTPGEPPSYGVTQGGPQDIAQFRTVVDDGAVPRPELLDQVGFFAEHALTQPAADCGEVVCVHPSLAVAPRFDDGNWTMAFVSLNTSIAPGTGPRPPVHVVAVVEDSPTTATMRFSLSTALNGLAGELTPEDRISVVLAETIPTILLDKGTGGSFVFSSFSPFGPVRFGPDVPTTAAVDLYSALEAGYRLLDSTPDHQGRLLLITSGQATEGITDPAHIVALAAGHAERGQALSVVGVGPDFQAELPRRLGELGAGTYAYAEDEEDLGNVIAGEAKVNLVSIATRFSLRLEPAPGYRVGRIYGARSAVLDGNAAVLGSPALFVAQRESALDTDLGRRGGGGGLFVELIADETAGAVGPGALAFTVHTAYDDVVAALPVELTNEVTNTLAPGQNPERLWPEFSDPQHPKAFMMLNMYLALQATTRLQDQGDCGRALGIVEMMAPSVELWQAEFQDPDIAADSVLLQKLGRNIQGTCTAKPAPDPSFEGGCFSI